MRRCTSIFAYIANFRQHTGITVQGVLNRYYKLRLFIDDEELKLRTQDNRTLTPEQRPYVPYFPLFTLNDGRECVEVFL